MSHVILYGHPTYVTQVLEWCRQRDLYAFDPAAWQRSRIRHGDEIAMYIRCNSGTEDVDELVADELHRSIGEASRAAHVVGNWPMHPGQIDMFPWVFGDQTVKVVEIGENDALKVANGALEGWLKPHSFTRLVPESPEDVPRTLEMALEVIMNHTLYPGTRLQKTTLADIDTHPKTPLDQVAKRADAISSARIVQLSLAYADSKILTRQFCGTHPVSVTLQSLPEMRQKPYCVSKKLDGVRYFLILVDATMWFMDRSARVWEGPSHSAFGLFDHSLLDVEVCGFDGELSLVVLDIVCAMGLSVRGRDFYGRLSAGKTIVNQMRKCCERYFGVTMQHYIPVHRVHQEGALRQDESKYDGLVFTPIKSNYRLGRTMSLLKWKPPDKSTVDVVWLEEEPFSAYVLSDDGLVWVGYIVDERPAELKSGDVVECAVLAAGVPYPLPPECPRRQQKEQQPKKTFEETGMWADAECELELGATTDPVLTIDKIRTDKTQPNVLSTFERVLDSLAESITFSQLDKELFSHPDVIAAAARDDAGRRERRGGRWNQPPGGGRSGRGAWGR